MNYSTFCVHRGGNIIDSPRNIGLIRLKKHRTTFTKFVQVFNYFFTTVKFSHVFRGVGGG